MKKDIDILTDDFLFNRLNEAREVKRSKTGKVLSTLAYGSLTRRIEKWKKENGAISSAASEAFFIKYGRPVYHSKKSRKKIFGRKMGVLSKLQIGKIYTFEYLDPISLKNGEPFDPKPNVLFVKSFKASTTGNTILMGINLNYLEPYVRQDLLKTIYYKWRQKYQKDGSTENIKIFSGNTFYKIVESMLLRKSYAKYYKNSIKMYVWNRCENVRRVNYADWVLVSIGDFSQRVQVGENLKDRILDKLTDKKDKKKKQK